VRLYVFSYSIGRSRKSFLAAEISHSGLPKSRRTFHRAWRQRAGVELLYYENEPGRRSAAKLLSEDEARRIAANIAGLPKVGLPKFAQLHSSLNGGSLEQGGIDGLMAPAPPLDADTLLDPALLLDVDTLRDP
jgi:hypothetical protein